MRSVEFGKISDGAGGGVRTRGFWAHSSPDYEFRPLSLAGALPAEPPRQKKKTVVSGKNVRSKQIHPVERR